MKTSISKVVTALVLSVGIPALLVAGEACGKGNREGRGNGKGGEVRSAMKECRSAMKEKIKAHMEEQKKENEEFRESLKDQDGDKISAIIAHHEQQYSENKAFMKDMQAEGLANLKKVLAENEVPEDKINEMVERVTRRQAEMVEHHEQQHEENVKFLNELRDKDMTPEEKQEAIKAHMKKQREENHALRKQRRQGRKGGRQRHGKKENTEE